MTENLKNLYQRIASTISASEKQVQVAVEMLDAGDTVPFISRYRKEATGGLTDTQLRDLEQHLGYLRSFIARRESILTAIEEQDALTDALRKRIMQVETKSELEDLYLPFKKKRRTKAQIAIEAGLAPLADLLWNTPSTDPVSAAKPYLAPDKGIADEKAALDGARSILVERFAEDATLIGRVREQLQTKSYLCSSKGSGKSASKASGSDHDTEKFNDYLDHQEPLSKVPGHRALAMFRGRSEGALTLRLLLKEAEGYGDQGYIDTIANHLGFVNKRLPADAWREQVVSWVWKVKLMSTLETELLTELKIRADFEAISVFAANLRDLLLSAPAGARATLGLDPGYRSGVKVCVIDANGKVVQHATIYPHKPQGQWKEAVQALKRLSEKNQVELIAVGNGTASRETEKLAEEVMKVSSQKGMLKVLVSEAGASVYSASKIAEEEFPELDVTIRGAVSIARRLQDPLAELVKIDPKAIGVGQYQHDVSQTALARSLETTVEDCVNAVGVNLDTASAALLSRVAGLSPTLAENIVTYRDEHGTFKNRTQLKKVPRLGPKAFEQCAGFLRISDGTNPLDASGVHPESYPVVKRILDKSKRELKDVIGDSEFLKSLEPAQYTDEQFGEPTVQDILLELDKPGRDPRPEFRAVKFAEGVESIKDLTDDQILEGKVTNVTAFGAFVDVGVHQDGLVHISAMSDTYVKDPRSVVKAGDIVQVKVMSVDAERKRIALSMRLTDKADDNDEDRGRTRRSKSAAYTSHDQSHNNKKSGGNNTGGKQSHKNTSTRKSGPKPEKPVSALALSLGAALADKPTD
ncbi:MAG: RNA-binding transcriptional accessory protein [Granulosicoccus sp.]|nr:RNA-binding transcriptional accessory protein [Granulosicoccus sp.]